MEGHSGGNAWQALTTSPTFSEIPLWKAMEPKGEEEQDLEMLHRPSRPSRSTAHQWEIDPAGREPLAGERKDSSLGVPAWDAQKGRCCLRLEG